MKAEDTCIVNVTWVNEPLSVHAGQNQTADEGTTVIFDASRSFVPDDGIASYRWKQTDTSGHPVTLSDPTAEKTTFVAPAVDTETVLSFELTVADWVLHQRRHPMRILQTAVAGEMVDVLSMLHPAVCGIPSRV